MPHFIIEQTTTATVLFDGEAYDEQHALEVLAQDAGYADYATMVEETSGADTLRVIRV